MREIDTDALGLVAPALGVGNPATATEAVHFDDDNLQQVLDISRLVRRAKAGPVPQSLAGDSGGVFGARFLHTHAAVVDTVTTTANPYNSPGFGELAKGIDIWLIPPFVIHYTGVLGDFKSARLVIATAQSNQVNLQSGLASATGNQELAVWSGGAIIAVGTYGLELGTGKPTAASALGPVRWPRLGTNMLFQSRGENSTAVTMTCGIQFTRAGSGQDALGGY